MSADLKRLIYAELAALSAEPTEHTHEHGDMGHTTSPLAGTPVATCKKCEVSFVYYECECSDCEPDAN